MFCYICREKLTNIVHIIPKKTLYPIGVEREDGEDEIAICVKCNGGK